ncbi:TonB system transport protein ExbD [Rhizobium sp. CFBP 8762]|uniref:TonB system transport protein ExbD n=1 Tax=Rhizobium sp. CFBP 8762 TaxID=2775279 RepID=UPI001786585A|nr:TonB system transport protein ExbD [Rhizobium sp. CFBP 8762]MBD8554641.1 TonB system transport protein ExbD [Rhizobium sp. CFBP 8762]
MAGKIREGGDDLEENSEINVTPFIDVILVLLIIFMVAAPLATVDVKVDLPQSVAQPSPPPVNPVWLSLKADLTLYLGNDPISREAFAPSLERATEGKKDTRIYLKADQSVDYGELTGVMNMLQKAGYSKIALVGLDMGSAPAL